MRAVTSVVVEPGGRLGAVQCEPPLTVRQVQSEVAGTCALCLVGTAAGPLAGDELEFALTLHDGADATLQATGASIAQGAGGRRSMRTTLQLGAGSSLAGRPGAVIVAAGSRVDLTVAIDLAADAAIEWHEVLVLGRTGEPPGAATMRWSVTRDGCPVLRQFVDLTDAALTGWRGLIGGHRVLATSFRSGPGVAARTVVHSPDAVTARLDDHTELTTVLAGSTASARGQLGAIERSVAELV